jgi:hypothetical protein
MSTTHHTVYASEARTATPTAAVLSTNRIRALRLVIDVTAVAATPSVVVTIDTLDATSGKYINLLTSAAITATGTTTLNIGPGLTVAANVTANAFLGDNLRVTMTHADADSITYSVGAHLIRA